MTAVFFSEKAADEPLPRRFSRMSACPLYATTTGCAMKILQPCAVLPMLAAAIALSACGGSNSVPVSVAQMMQIRTEGAGAAPVDNACDPQEADEGRCDRVDDQTG